MSGIERYFRDSGYLHERLGNALSYLKDPREFFWKQKAKKEAAALIQEPELAALQREAKELFPEGRTYAKYTDFERYFAINLRRIYRLGLPSFLPSGKKNLLDIGCGAGFFCLLCKRLGYDVTGMDLSGVAIFDYLIPRFHIPRIVHRIEPQQPLPLVERRFDYITAFAICFHELEKNGEWTGRWERKDWLFFLDDIAENYIAPGGRMYLFFNDWPHGDFNEVKSRIFPCRYNVRVGHKVLDFRFD